MKKKISKCIVIISSMLLLANTTFVNAEGYINNTSAIESKKVMNQDKKTEIMYYQDDLNLVDIQKNSYIQLLNNAYNKGNLNKIKFSSEIENKVEIDSHKQIKQLYGMSTLYDNLLIFWENEENNSLEEANNIELNSLVYGTITDYFFDMDYYKIVVDQTGILGVLGIWIGDYYSYGWEDDLGIMLLNDKGEILTLSIPYIDNEGYINSSILEYKVNPGTYYIVVLQTSEYESLYVNELYGLLVQLLDIQVEGISINKKDISLEVGNSENFTVSIYPSDATNKSVNWKSSNSSVATIDQSGKVTGVSPGTAVITATTIDGGFTATSHVRVTPKDEWEIWQPQYNIPVDKSWIVEFNLPVDAETVTTKNIYVTNKDGEMISMTYLQDNLDLQCIRVKPVEDYNPGETYTLWIRDLRGKDGEILNTKLKMNFTIQ